MAALLAAFGAHAVDTEAAPEAPAAQAVEAEAQPAASPETPATAAAADAAPAAADAAPVADAPATPDAPAVTAAALAETPAAPESPAPAEPAAAKAETEALPPPPPPAGAFASGADVQLEKPRKSHRRWGVGLDAGFPDVTSLNVLYRPFRYLRFSGGALYNYAGFGVRGGVSVQPYFPIAPSFTVEGGHYFEANARAKVERYTEVDANVAPLLERVGYSFVSAQVGLELGHHNAFVFFVRAGVSRMWVSPHNANEAARAATEGDSTRITHMDDPSIRLGVPNAKVGFLVFFH